MKKQGPESLFNGPNSLERFRDSNREKFESLTDREMIIVCLIAAGLKGPDISRKINILPEELENCKTVIHHKLAIHNRSGYIKYAFAFGLISF